MSKKKSKKRKKNIHAFDDIEICKLYGYKKKESLFVIVSERADVAFYCKESVVPICKRILELFNGENRISDVNNILAEEYPTVDTQKLVEKIANSPLIVGKKKTNSSSEISRTSLKLKEYPLKSLKKIPIGVWNILYYLELIMFLFALIVLIFLFCNGVNISDYTAFVSNTSYLLGLFISFLLSIITLLFHEFGHVVCGVHNSIYPKSLSFALHLNFQPILYVKSQTALYSSSRKSRIEYHLGGPAWDFIFCGLFSFLGYMLKNNLFYFLAFSSAQRCFFNLMPFGLTDGYFLLSVLLKTVNLRINFVNLISFQWKKMHFSLTDVIYILCSSVSVIISAFYTSFWVLGIISDFFVLGDSTKIIGYIITVLIVAQLVVISTIKSRKE